MRQYRVYDIRWDTDGVVVELPQEVVVSVEEEEDAIDAVSDKVGWCIFSAEVELVG